MPESICPHCKNPFTALVGVSGRLGRLPVYCSKLCRGRAGRARYNAKKAAESGKPPPVAPEGPPRHGAPHPGSDLYEYTDEETAFLAACERARRKKGKGFLTLVEVLAVAQELGYRKVAEPTDPTRHGEARGD